MGIFFIEKYQFIGTVVIMILLTALWHTSIKTMRNVCNAEKNKKKVGSHCYSQW